MLLLLEELLDRGALQAPIPSLSHPYPIPIPVLSCPVRLPPITIDNPPLFFEERTHSCTHACMLMSEGVGL